ncbi:TPA: hypothetical protein ACKW3N_002544 [Staphylococcus aureus]
MNIYNTKTTLEKLKDYNDDIKIDSNYLEEWRNVRTLLTDEYFEDMLKNMNISKKSLVIHFNQVISQKIVKNGYLSFIIL